MSGSNTTAAQDRVLNDAELDVDRALEQLSETYRDGVSGLRGTLTDVVNGLLEVIADLDGQLDEAKDKIARLEAAN